MKGFDPKTSFRGDIARTYDDGGGRGDEDETVRFLAGLADNALEFAIGTGRVALPLRAAGVRVEGIEQSPAMPERRIAAPDSHTPATQGAEAERVADEAASSTSSTTPSAT